MNREKVLSKTNDYKILQKVFIGFCHFLKSNPTINFKSGVRAIDDRVRNSLNILVLDNYVTLKFEYHNYNNGIIGKIDLRSGESQTAHIIGTIYFNELGNWKERIDAPSFQYNFSSHDVFFVFVLGCFFDKYYSE